MATNEDSTDKGKNTVYPDPPGRASGTIDALWGDAPPPRPHGWVGNYGTGVMEQAKDVRHGVLGRIFSGMAESKANAKAVVSQLLDHAARDEFEAHSANLTKEKTSSARHLAADETLTDKVLGAFGRR